MTSEIRTLTVEVEVPLYYVFAHAAEACGGLSDGSDHRDILERAALVALARRHAAEAYELDRAIVASFEENGTWDSLEPVAKALSECVDRLAGRRSEAA